MKHTLEELRRYWRMEKHDLDREDEQEDGLHVARLEYYDYVRDTIEAIETLMKEGEAGQ